MKLELLKLGLWISLLSIGSCNWTNSDEQIHVERFVLDPADALEKEIMIQFVPAIKRDYVLDGMAFGIIRMDNNHNKRYDDVGVDYITIGNVNIDTFFPSNISIH